MKSNIKTTNILGLFIVAAMLLSSCSESKTENKTAVTAVNVTVEKALQPKGKGFFNASGQIEAENFANISTRMMGYVSKVYVKVGDKVNKGQALIDINNSDMEARRAQTQAGINQAKASFLTAEKNYQRFQVLLEQKSASQKEFDDVKTQYDIAKAQVESAEQMQNEVDAMLSYTNIKAPFNGIITATSVKIGDMANPGQHLLSLEAPGDFVAMAMISENDIPFVNKNDSVKVFIKSNGMNITGTVSEISTSSHNTGGQYLVKIHLNIPDGIKLYSGMFISAAFPSNNELSSQVLIPKDVIITKGDLQGIYTVSASNTAILRWLKLGKSLGDKVEVLSGLSSGETYILSAESKLYNGARLNIK